MKPFAISVTRELNHPVQPSQLAGNVSATPGFKASARTVDHALLTKPSAHRLMPLLSMACGQGHQG